MRCLQCHYEGIDPLTELCPNCGVYLPSLLREVLPKGTQLKNNTYQIDYALGRGSFGITYQAHHNILGYRVAIKEFFPQDYAIRNTNNGEITIPHNQEENFQKGLKRFLKEGQLLVQLNHPNVVKIQDLFAEKNTAYIVMELIEGATLGLELDSQPGKKLLPRRVEILMEQLVSALTAIHEAGIFHLDIKPNNILVTSKDRLVLVDFGSAKQVASNSINRTRFFTESYAAPEVIIGGKIGRESDVFELGMLLYEMLTGTLPPKALTRLFEGDTFTPHSLDNPWRTLVTSALHLKQEYRPKTVKEWWESRYKNFNSPGFSSGNGTSEKPLGMTLRGYFVLPFFKEQGMQRRFGRGLIKKVFFIKDNLAVVIAAGGTALFELKSGETLWEIDCPADKGTLSLDCSQLALIWQEIIYIWDLKTGGLLQQLKGHSKLINDVAFSPDGQILVSGSNDESLKVWDVISGQIIYHLQGHNAAVTCVSFSSDGRFIASGSRDQSVRIWLLDSGQEFRVLESPNLGIESIAFSVDNQWIATGSRDHKVRLWTIESAEILDRFDGHKDWVTSVAFSQDGHLLAFAGGINDKKIRVWNLISQKEILPLEGHGNTVNTIMFSPDSRYLISGSYDYTLRVWDLNEGGEIQQLKKHTNWVYTVACSPDNRLITCAGNDHLIHVWDSVQNRKIMSLAGHTDFVTSLAFSEDGKFLVSGSWDKTVRLWEVMSGKQLRCWPGHQDLIKSVAFSPNKRFIASGSWDKTVRLWDLSSPRLTLTGGKGVRILKGHTQQVECVTFSLDNLLLASGSWDQTIRIWEVSSGQEVQQFHEHTSPVLSVAFSPDSQWLISGGKDNILILWDVMKGTIIHKLQGHTHYVNSVAFSPDGKLIVSGSHDCTVRLWDVESGSLLQVWQGHTNSVKSVCFSADGTFITSGDNDGVVRLWRV
ncbi:serine/threonine protein kinase with WD40 repeats [Gloeothece citriformis PCC 7424]|uniref:Serine/threonine protein kinase with WD40 repeats n=1 Tax=Gloeothece citriformis (strain PCC 7424) TaxID=65393 RepID=B7K850_GLOC7|nr:serine/threonine-protein kinase [Gloeothece citriformis]ACK68538.1 serine/threonine protein kinase with WD40 repeats [Gloeothece citriformis PCC 7424]